MHSKGMVTAYALIVHRIPGSPIVVRKKLLCRFMPPLSVVNSNLKVLASVIFLSRVGFSLECRGCRAYHFSSKENAFVFFVFSICASLLMS